MPSMIQSWDLFFASGPRGETEEDGLDSNKYQESVNVTHGRDGQPLDIYYARRLPMLKDDMSSDELKKLKDALLLYASTDKQHYNFVCGNADKKLPDIHIYISVASVSE